MVLDTIYVNGKCDKTELIMSVLSPMLLGVLSFLLVMNHTGVYVRLIPDKLTPAAVVFPVVWLVLLVLMGIASYRAKRVEPGSVCHVYYAAQLLGAFIWNVVLLRFGEIKVAVAIIIVYLFFLTATFFEFDKLDKRAGRLMLPAVVWALLMALLNYYLLRNV